jgi:hypothetical protein
VAEHRLAGGREAHAARVADEQARADVLLQACDVLRDGGLREAERVGSGRERAADGDLAERLQEPQVEHKATLSAAWQIVL